ncbi:hypothetical protein HERIO_215 [Hepatospora eriocheir]|uniref:ISXO2-like transposase domain-containing protein n=1 Tax=Hepatospora eriocheir TaxID=1081669 RepID=A0A1X0QDS5_9MICR|nr:hypothetical protein HERIO_215 [Hepatospora eriocheir]
MESLDDADRKNNYGERVNGPWVFSMAEEGSRKVKIFVVKKRDRDSLLPLLLEHVNKSSIIHSDDQKAYSGLGTVFNDHKVVNHSENFVDLNTRCHTQLIECIWGQAKLKIIKNKMGTTLTMLLLGEPTLVTNLCLCHCDTSETSVSENNIKRKLFK